MDVITAVLAVLSSMMSPVEMDFVCQGIVGSDVEDHTLMVTAYWPFHDDGEIMDGWNGQCNSDCSTTANGTKITKDLEWKSAACISEMIGSKVYLSGREVVCNDTFGHPLYRKPNYNDYTGKCVVPIDVMTDNFGLYFEHQWSTNWIAPQVKREPKMTTRSELKQRIR